MNMGTLIDIKAYPVSSVLALLLQDKTTKEIINAHSTKPLYIIIRV